MVHQINNIETIYWIRDIIEKGSTWYADQGKNGRKGFHSFSVSGRVKNPGVKIAPAGTTVQELIDNTKGPDWLVRQNQPSSLTPKITIAGQT